MKNDLISRQAAIDALGEAPEVWTDSPEEFAALHQWEMDVTAIEAVPSAEPPYQYSEAYVKQIRAERDYLQELVNDMTKPKTGRWIPVDSFSAYGGDEATWGAHGNPIAFYYCSECKEHAYAGEDGESLLTDFCPDCGADMRGERDD